MADFGEKRHVDGRAQQLNLLAVVPPVQDRAVVAQRSERPSIQAEGGGASPTPRLHFSVTSIAEVNPLLAREHYLGPMKGGRIVVGGYVGAELVAAQVWRGPTSRHLPGHWLELSRWCLTPAAGKNAGSRMQAWTNRLLKRTYADVTTLISYSDPSVGHTGALYRASGWWWAPTWLRLRPPPTANGDWGGKGTQAVKDRWVLDVRPDAARVGRLAVNDNGALRRYLTSEEWTTTTFRWPSRLVDEATVKGLLSAVDKAVA